MHGPSYGPRAKPAKRKTTKRKATKKKVTKRKTPKAPRRPRGKALFIGPMPFIGPRRPSVGTRVDWGRAGAPKTAEALMKRLRGRQRKARVGKKALGNTPSRYLLMSGSRLLSKTGSVTAAWKDRARAKRYGYKNLKIVDTRKGKDILRRVRRK
jgi:hypothetical protein